MDYNGSNFLREDTGLSLLEVLVSLLISGIIAGFVLSQAINQYRLANSILAESEMNYALLRAGQVLALAVQEGEKIVWKNDTLIITYGLNRKQVSDSYYLADKDFDGNYDLYREHLAVPNPVATGLTAFSCKQINQGLWEISLKAGCKEKETGWERIVKQKCLQRE